MKAPQLIISVVLTLASSSCYYRNHVPVSSLSDSKPKIVEMKVGERKKIKSKTILTEISPGFMVGPAYHMRSSNPKIVVIDSHGLEDVAWIKAIAPGMARIEYNDSENTFTPIRVVQKGEQGAGGNGEQAN